MPTMRYCILQQETELIFVEMPADYAYQLSALILRLNKEVDKLTADNVPALPQAVAECDSLDLLRESDQIAGGLDYINRLEQSFSSIQETSYPLISLLTEIRALQAQLEQWYEEAAEETELLS
ncbi:hydrolase/acyltransferase [Paenibacillus yonginensis]|uniref:Hydrolase/acyltransferase n=1 Tax=Paenibacillus yonginensis TaxID=1462996 RepID=A0A1B1MWK7_9BACL|nr:hydrolase/acyltransferase [Paenibacillus yonginensis]ANS73527.1 hydrolase/acyltransferase [Paenibacillus yonginensis]